MILSCKARPIHALFLYRSAHAYSLPPPTPCITAEEGADALLKYASPVSMATRYTAPSAWLCRYSSRQTASCQLAREHGGPSVAPLA